MRYPLLIGVVIASLPLMSLSALTGPSAVARASKAGAMSSNPVTPISELYKALTRIEGEGGSTPFADRARLLAPAIDQAFNIPAILHTSIGPRYASIPGDQQQELERVFRQFTIARYVSNFTADSGDTLKVMPQARKSPYGSDEIVQTQLISKGGTTTKLDYVMRQFAQGWKVVDVLLDGHISQVAVQRSDFASTVETGDAKPLIERLKKKIRSFSSS
ncbi:ABC transporter substrate-binding protein [Lichenicoccus sp.]|uniref:ABC transporter substrate-binding protein n=1 Tax=Lichenicoccus sp. TaxID=2781899 RepID=UPI003D0E5D10